MKTNRSEHEFSHNLIYFRANDARKAIKLLLGRDPLSSHEVRYYATYDDLKLFTCLLENDEFQQEVFLPVILTGYASNGRYNGEPSRAMLNWCLDKLPLENFPFDQTTEKLTWRNLLAALWSNAKFLKYIQEIAGGLNPIDKFQKGLRTNSEDTMSGSAAIFSRPRLQVPGCKLLVVEALGRKQLNKDKNIDISKKISKTFNISKTEAYIAEYDPQIIIDFSILGRFMLDIDVEYTYSPLQKDLSYLQIFFDFGDGYDESASYTLPILDNRVSANLLINAENEIKHIRIDPSVQASTFIINRLLLSHL